jgi:hypothetical protein
MSVLPLPLLFSLVSVGVLRRTFAGIESWMRADFTHGHTHAEVQNERQRESKKGRNVEKMAGGLSIVTSNRSKLPVRCWMQGSSSSHGWHMS